MSGIHCNNCGAELDEAPTLLPDRRPPCPRCGSLARRFEQEVTNTVALSDGGTATDALSVVEPNGSATIAHAEPVTLTVAAHDASVSVQAHAEVAQGAGEAFDLTVQTVNVHGIPSADQVGDATVVRGPRIIRDHLVVQARSLWWTQLTDKGGWLLQVVDEAGEEIAIAANHDPVEALAAVAKFVLPGHPG